MTLADTKVRRLLNKEFIATWGNLEGDSTAGSSFAHAPKSSPGTCIRGNGEHNIQILVATPAGELLGVTAGFLSEDDLAAELTAMLELGEALQRTTEKEQLDDAHREQFVRDAHERQLVELGKRTVDEHSDGPLADWAQRRALTDHRYSAKRALMPIADFRTVDMLGNSKTFFGTSSGGQPEGRIGEGLDMPQMPQLPQMPQVPQLPKMPGTGGRSPQKRK